MEEVSRALMNVGAAEQEQQAQELRPAEAQEENTRLLREELVQFRQDRFADILLLYLLMRKDDMAVIQLLVALSFWTLGYAMYYHSAEKEEKCVIEDLPADMLVTGRYKLQKWDMNRHDYLPSAPGLGMFVTVKAPNDEILVSKLYGPDGKFTFTSHSTGEHVICMQSNSTNLIAFASSRLRIHLDIQVGEHPFDYATVDPKDKVKEVSFGLEHLRGEVNHIMKEQEYQREREEYYRQRSEDMNNNVLWWAIAQIFILTTVGIWQIKRFKDFLIAKKVV
ncbi:transmembrane emp24 domain-containing protein 11-like [Mixophyes fleayi]|uniref:transmembrane emp24 domain-containing protein 11-like n=1 Tax=Mixophyes fleayi TaxID=3061075 RepID=UPI003F4D99AF